MTVLFPPLPLVLNLWLLYSINYSLLNENPAGREGINTTKLISPKDRLANLIYIELQDVLGTTQTHGKKNNYQHATIWKGNDKLATN